MKNPIDQFDWYHDVVENAPDIFDVVDREGRFLFTNAKGTPSRGNTFIGTTIYEYFLPEYHETVRTKIAMVFETGENNQYELATDYLGNRRYYMTNLAPIKRAGVVVAVVLYIREFTELKKMQHAMKELNESLESHVLERTKKLQEFTERLQTTEAFSIALRHSNSRDEVLKKLGNLLFATFNSDTAGIYWVGNNQLELSTFINNIYQPPTHLNENEDRYFYSLLKENSIRIVQIPAVDKEGCHFCEFVHQKKLKTLVVIPLLAKSAMVGVIYLAYKKRQRFNEDDLQLMRSFVEATGNTLHRIELMNQLQVNIANRENQQQILYKIMAITSETVDLDDLLKKILAEILRAMNCGIGVIHLMERGKITRSINTPEDLPKHFKSDLEQTKKIALKASTYFDKKNFSFQQRRGSAVKNLVAPIRSKGKILGVISLIGECLDAGDQEMLRLITSIADEIGLAVESARHRKRSEETLLLEERQRLARDLHDAVSQSLYGLVLSADISKKLLQIKEFGTLEDTLNDIETFALQSLREMRLMLFELRPISFEAEGLTGALELRLNTVERRAGIHTDLEVKGDEHISSPLDLELYRVTTEALNNALKHSNATQIQVHLEANLEFNVCDLRIIDNGTGFDPRNRKPGGIGISSMQERALRMGGQLSVESNPSFGTVVHFVCPLDAHKLEKRT